jgi:CRP-like cAMP-binding protein
MNVMDARGILGSVPFLTEALDDKELTILAGQARTHKLAKGDVVISEERPGHSMFVIVDGEVVVTVAGETEPLARLGKGAIVGEMSLLTGAPRNATVTADTAVEALEVDKAAFANVLWMSPHLVERFVEMLFKRQLELDRLMGGAAWGTMRPGKAELTEMIQNFYTRAE